MSNFTMNKDFKDSKNKINFLSNKVRIRANKNNSLGFTLIEIIVVILIIGLLYAFLVGGIFLKAIRLR